MRFLVVALLSLQAFVLSTNAMTYHDNDVNFKFISPNWTLKQATFLVQDLSISSGQDPDPRNRVGDVREWVFDRFRFSVGRNGSKTVANWFKSKMPEWQNTFSSYPDKLNFAFRGLLALNLFGPENPTWGETFEVRSVIFAQGHTLGSNNWWFAGGSCANIGDNTVNCDIVRLSAPTEAWLIDFKRGGNDDNTVEASNLRRA
ncbi:hypothetical protein BKA70DRAFT_1530381 [Coprinopsis sp. MPI-PUGE-AT-0042]|nr:hypothetical protein BKA70DRAFT_1530381 [Coprinopsis sp. MPI-PUGE-AT-0042]